MKWSFQDKLSIMPWHWMNINMNIKRGRGIILKDSDKRYWMQMVKKLETKIHGENYHHYGDGESIKWVYEEMKTYVGFDELWQLIK